MRPSIPTATGRKRLGSPADPERDVHKRQWRTGSLDEEALDTPTSYTPLGTHATPSNTGMPMETTFLEKFLHMELNVPLLIEQYRR